MVHVQVFDQYNYSTNVRPSKP